MVDFSKLPADHWKRLPLIETRELEADGQPDPLAEIKLDYYSVETYEDYLISTMDRMDLDSYLPERDSSPEPAADPVSSVTEEAIYDYYLDKKLYHWE